MYVCSWRVNQRRMSKQWQHSFIIIIIIHSIHVAQKSSWWRRWGNVILAIKMNATTIAETGKMSKLRNVSKSKTCREHMTLEIFDHQHTTHTYALSGWDPHGMYSKPFAENTSMVHVTHTLVRIGSSHVGATMGRETCILLVMYIPTISDCIYNPPGLYRCTWIFSNVSFHDDHPQHLLADFVCYHYYCIGRCSSCCWPLQDSPSWCSEYTWILYLLW